MSEHFLAFLKFATGFAAIIVIAMFALKLTGTA